VVQIESTHGKFTEELQPLIQRQVSASAAELRSEAAQATALLAFKHASLSMELSGHQWRSAPPESKHARVRHERTITANGDTAAGIHFPLWRKVILAACSPWRTTRDEQRLNTKVSFEMK
jgi:hypothetical protein